jgi:hypothetical protein
LETLAQTSSSSSPAPGHADIVVAAQIDFVVRILLGILIDLELVGSQIGVSFSSTAASFFGRSNGSGCFDFSTGSGSQGNAAFDAGHRIFLAEIVKARPTLRAATLRAPFSLHHR